MSRIKNQNELILSRIERLRLLQPNLDSKPGTVARDILIENPAIEMAGLYSDLGIVQNSSSIANSLGAELEKWGSNFGSPREKLKSSVGPALFLFSFLENEISIRSGELIYAKNGTSFKVLSSISLSPVNINRYKATANNYRADLDFLGLTEDMAVELLTEATSPGVSGNISKYFINRTSIFGITNVTNVQPFGGGTASESDTNYRNRILSSFNGSVSGGTLGYQNTVLSDPDVSDAVVINPGDTLMTRDGTIIQESENGTKTVLAEGTGGKVDIYVLGSRIQESSDSFIYRDKSNTSKAENEKNNFVLGQIADDANKTISRRRQENLEAGILPSQPINNIISITGSLSGPNFKSKSIDEYGRVTGNYELLKDSGEFSGSPWGFDALRWINSEIKDYPEDKTKGLFNGQDDLSFSDVNEITLVQQNITITNEVPKLFSSDRSLLQLSHFPVSSVTRIVNSTTGERYTIVDQNIDSNSGLNLTGKIKISGKTLPTASDILQADYVWIYYYHSHTDFDNLKNSSNYRTVNDSLDWGYGNLITKEPAAIFEENGKLLVNVIHPISAVLSVFSFIEEIHEITIVSGKLAIITNQEVENVNSIKLTSSGIEIWNSTGTFKNQVIFLPTSLSLFVGQEVKVQYNTVELYLGNDVGSFQNNKIFLSSGTIGTIVNCNYLADLGTLVSNLTLNQLPLVKDKNYLNNKNVIRAGFQPRTDYYLSSQIIKNLRKASSNLEFSLSGSFSPFTLAISGTTSYLVTKFVFRVPFSGLKIDLSAVFRNVLGLSSTAPLPNNVFISRIIGIQKVTTSDDLTVLSTDHEYDIVGYELLNNRFVLEECIKNSTLRSTELILPATEDNILFSPTVGDTLQVTFYYSFTSETEKLDFLRAGKLYTQKRFSEIDTIFVSSGTLSSSSLQSTMTINTLNQPVTRSRYKIKYNYKAPKTNERITVSYNYEKLISDNTLQIERTRPPGADVLIKSAKVILVDLTINIVVTKEVSDKKSSSVVLQNVQDAVTNAMTTKLEGILDSSDLVLVAGSISGVDRVRVIYFNKANQLGSVLSITAEKNEYLIPNDVKVNLETR